VEPRCTLEYLTKQQANATEDRETANRADLLKSWFDGPVLSAAFEDQLTCIRRVYRAAQEIASTPVGTQSEYGVSVEAIPVEFYAFRNNVFSTLFQAAYHLLHIEERRRRLYGQLIHLYRMWVTSADNLLDDEDKTVLPIRLSGDSHIMKQVITIMTADRILSRVLDQACNEDVITAAQARRLSDGTLQVLLPSAAEEAAEEGGIVSRASPDEVLSKIHALKTGMLFNVAFFGPEVVEERLDPAAFDRARKAYHQFGIGCQILDDIRDMAKDHCERRQNYILSQLHWTRDPFERELEVATVEPADRLLFLKAPSVVIPAARQAVGLLADSLGTLADMGLGLTPRRITEMARSILILLDLKELIGV
jgi:hypothetical protein